MRPPEPADIVAIGVFADAGDEDPSHADAAIAPASASRTLARALRRQMLGEVWRWAGAYGTSERNVGIDHWEITMVAARAA